MGINNFEGGEKINKKLCNCLIIICFILFSLNMAFASNETQINVDCLKNSDDVLNIDDLNQNSTINYTKSSKTIEITQDNYRRTNCLKLCKQNRKQQQNIVFWKHVSHWTFSGNIWN